MQVAAWPAELYESDRVAHALHDLFAVLEGGERGRLAAAVREGGGGQHQRSVVNPNPLREALSVLPGQLFRVGESLFLSLEQFLR